MSDSGSNASQRFTKPNSAPSVKEEQPAASFLMDFYHIVREPVLFFCRRIIFGPIQFKLLVSFAIIVIGSILKSLQLVPESYFSLKTNIFNRYFAKLGWAWTMGLLGPFIYLTLSTTHDLYRIVSRHLVRLLIATGIWYFTTMLFVRIELFTGSCKHVDMRGASRNVCVKGGYEWKEGIDFSGHTFLLLYAILVINEEVKSYDRGTKKVDQANKSAAAQGESAASTAKQERLEIYSTLIRVIYVALAGLTILWEFMLLSTALYFHHTVHKILAALVAVLFWYGTYYYWYRNDEPSLLYPAKPKN